MPRNKHKLKFLADRNPFRLPYPIFIILQIHVQLERGEMESTWNTFFTCSY
jgi:hypothetical protein